MSELDNSGIFMHWDGRFAKMIQAQLEDESFPVYTDMPAFSGIVTMPQTSKYIKCSYCKTQHNTLYLKEHSHINCSQCGAPLTI